MGIRGLFSYIQNYVEKALEWHKLHNCNLIIDGSNLAYDLYNNCKGKNVAFGGDYDKYAATIEDFFKKLLQCDVRPYVIMDGGYPLKRQKFKTVHDRIAQQVNTCGRVNPDNQSHLSIFPLLGRSVFVNVIQKLGITVLQCDFEADDEIVVIAKKLNAYVLSNDSDFYLFDVPFILLNSVNLKCMQKEIKKSETYKFIPCYVFNAEVFTEITKVSCSLLPVLAPVLGNDFLNPRFLRDFFISISHLRPRSTKMTERHKAIMSVIRWLSTQPPDPSEVLNKIINLLPDELSKKKVTVLMDTMQSYFPTSSTLEPWVGSHSSSCPLIREKRDVYYKDATSKINFASKCFIPVRVDKELKCSCDSRLETSMIHGALLPGWFIRAYRLELVPPIVANLLNKNYFFTIPQIEYQERKSVYLRLECIVRGVRGLLWATLERSWQMKERLEKPQLTFRGLLENKLVEDKTWPLNEEMVISNLSDDWSSENSEDESMGEEEEPKIIEISEKLIEMNMLTIEKAKQSKEYQKNVKKNACNIPSKYGIKSTEELESRKSKIKKDDINEIMEGISSDEFEDINSQDEDEEENPEEVNIELFKEKRKIPFMRWYIRNFNYLTGKKLYPEKLEKYRNMPTLFDMDRLSLEDRKKHFFKICQMKIVFEEELPKNIEFILFIICYWYKKYSGHIHYNTVLSTLMCVIMFCCIDGKCGRKRSKKSFEKVAEDSKKVQLINNNDDTYKSSMTILEIVNNLTKEECLLANLSLFQFHETDPVDNRKNYDRCAVHSFSEFQACFYFLNALNSLLCFPFPSISIESCWSGTFCYNVRKCFSTNENVSLVLASIFGKNLGIIYLFTRLYNIIQRELDLPIYIEHTIALPKEKKERIIKQSKKKLGLKSASQLGILTKKKKIIKKKLPYVDILNIEENELMECATEEELTLLAGNRFSKLLMI